MFMLLIRQYDTKSHFGTEYVLSSLRQKFWSVNSTLTVKRVRRKLYGVQNKKC